MSTVIDANTEITTTSGGHAVRGQRVKPSAAGPGTAGGDGEVVYTEPLHTSSGTVPEGKETVHYVDMTPNPNAAADGSSSDSEDPDETAPGLLCVRAPARPPTRPPARLVAPDSDLGVS